MIPKRPHSAWNWTAISVLATALFAMAGWVLTNSNSSAVTKAEVEDQGQELKDAQKQITRLEIELASEKCK